MVWDLRGALLRKQETESARLMDFEFRLRARTMRLLEDELGREAGSLVRQVALRDDAEIIAAVADEWAVPLDALQSRWVGCQSRAREQLITERGDPSPHRLA